MFPDNDGVRCGRAWTPFSIDIGVFVEPATESESGSGGLSPFFGRFTQEPADKIISVSHHLQSWLLSVFSRTDEVGGLVGGAFTIFVVDEPLALGYVNFEDNIAVDGDAGAVGVKVVVVGMTSDMSSVGVGVDFPSLEVVVVVVGGIGGVDLVGGGRDGCIGTVGDDVGVDHTALLVEVGDGEGLEEHGVEVELSAVGDAGVQAAGDAVAHHGEGHGRGYGSRGVGGVGCPAFAGDACGHGAETGVVNDGVIVALADVGFLDIERNGGAVGAVEGDFEACVVACLGDDIDREGGSGEGDFAVLGGHGGYVFDTVGALVVDVVELAVDEGGVGHGDDGRLVGLGLPLASVLDEVYVVGGAETLAVGGGAHDRGGGE